MRCLHSRGSTAIGVDKAAVYYYRCEQRTKETITNLIKDQMRVIYCKQIRLPSRLMRQAISQYQKEADHGRKTKSASKLKPYRKKDPPDWRSFNLQ